MDERELLLEMLRSEVCGQPMDESIAQQLNAERLQQLYSISAIHDLAHIPGNALRKLAFEGEDSASAAFNHYRAQAIWRYLTLERSYDKTCCSLEKEGLPFIPLKGSVLRRYYPEPWMRTSSDIDILVRETDLDRAIEVLKIGLGGKWGEKGDHDISLYTSGGIHIELHFDTIQDRYAVNTCRDVLGRIWEDAQPDEPGSFAHHMSDEMFYFYHMAHMAKHFGNGGCGIRPVLDVWILNHNVAHDRGRRDDLLKEGGLFSFANMVEKLAEVWFSKAEPDDFDALMGDYILRAGVFGNNENRAAVGQARMGGKIRYILLRRVFMPFDFLKAEYPILQKHKWLFPFYQIVRWVRVLKNGLVSQVVRELRANTGAQKDKVLTVKEMLKKLGLD